MEELEPTYKLRDLYPRYLMMLGALAATALSPNESWRETYKQRLEEIEGEINALNNNTEQS